VCEVIRRPEMESMVGDGWRGSIKVKQGWEDRSPGDKLKEWAAGWMSTGFDLAGRPALL
jgi:hypothetical protein